MQVEISHSFDEETPESKARWFQSLPLSERMEMLCFFTDMILENNPGIVERIDVKSVTKRIRVLEKAFEPMDQDEKELMESIEKGEWQPVKNLKREKEAAMQAARNTLKKDRNASC